MAMQDVYDFFFDVNSLFLEKGLPRLDDILRLANMSGLISDMLTTSLAKHSRSLVQNAYFNGHPDLLVRGKYANDSAKAGEDGIEIKTTRKSGGAVDTHGGRDQWLCVFVYQVDATTEPAQSRHPVRFTNSISPKSRRKTFAATTAANSELAPRRYIGKASKSCGTIGSTRSSRLSGPMASAATAA